MAHLSYVIKDLIKEILIHEIGEANAEPYEFRKISNVRYEFDVLINDKYPAVVTCKFDELDEVKKQYYFPPRLTTKNNFLQGKCYNVGYDVNGDVKQFDTTDMKQFLRIMATLCEICKDFMEHMNPQGLYAFPSPKSEENDKGQQQKHNIYDAYFMKQIDKFRGYYV